MASGWGKMKDKFKVAQTFDETEKAVIKATRHKIKAPKEKHVRRLILFSAGQQGGSADNVSYKLSKRLETPLDWIVVLKTLIVMHRLIRDGNSSVIDVLRLHSHQIQVLERFTDVTSAGARQQSAFVQKYAMYLLEFINISSTLQCKTNKPGELKQQEEISSVLEDGLNVMKIYKRFLQCQVPSSSINNVIILSAMELLLKDSFQLYGYLNIVVLICYEERDSLDSHDVQNALSVYRDFIQITSDTMDFYDSCRSFAKDLPQLKHAPTSVLEAFESMMDGDSSGSIKPKKHKKKKKDMKDRYEERISLPSTPDLTPDNGRKQRSAKRMPHVESTSASDQKTDESDESQSIDDFAAIRNNSTVLQSVGSQFINWDDVPTYSDENNGFADFNNNNNDKNTDNNNANNNQFADFSNANNGFSDFSDTSSNNKPNPFNDEADPIGEDLFDPFSSPITKKKNRNNNTNNNSNNTNERNPPQKPAQNDIFDPFSAGNANADTYEEKLSNIMIAQETQKVQNESVLSPNSHVNMGKPNYDVLRSPPSNPFGDGNNMNVQYGNQSLNNPNNNVYGMSNVGNVNNMSQANNPFYPGMNQQSPQAQVQENPFQSPPTTSRNVNNPFV